MTSRQPPRGKAKGKAKSSAAPSEIYQEMLAEALPLQMESLERPLKRRKIGPRGHAISSLAKAKVEQIEAEDDDEAVEFEDVPLPAQFGSDEDSDSSQRPQQTIYRSEDSDSDSADEFDAGIFDTTHEASAAPQPSGDLELTLKARPSPPKKATARRKAVTKAEKALRLQTHKMHVLCLLAYVERRNAWCSDESVQASLRPLLSKKLVDLLNPPEDKSQFQRTETLKRGLTEVGQLWKKKFKIKERGMRRALWAENDSDIENVS